MYIIETDHDDGSVEYGPEYLDEADAMESLSETVSDLRYLGARVWQMKGEDNAWFASLPGEVGATRYRVVEK